MKNVHLLSEKFTSLPTISSIQELRWVDVDDGHPEAGVLPRLVPHPSLLQLLADLVHLQKTLIVGLCDIFEFHGLCSYAPV